jgi:hypothetical protein
MIKKRSVMERKRTRERWQYGENGRSAVIQELYTVDEN